MVITPNPKLTLRDVDWSQIHFTTNHDFNTILTTKNDDSLQLSLSDTVCLQEGRQYNIEVDANSKASVVMNFCGHITLYAGDQANFKLTDSDCEVSYSSDNFHQIHQFKQHVEQSIDNGDDELYFTGLTEIVGYSKSPSAEEKAAMIEAVAKAQGVSSRSVEYVGFRLNSDGGVIETKTRYLAKSALEADVIQKSLSEKTFNARMSREFTDYFVESKIKSFASVIVASSSLLKPVTLHLMHRLDNSYESMNDFEVTEFHQHWLVVLVLCALVVLYVLQIKSLLKCVTNWFVVDKSSDVEKDDQTKYSHV